MTVVCPICKAPAIGDESHCGICGYELPQPATQNRNQQNSILNIDEAYEDRTQVYDPYTKESIYRIEHAQDYELSNQSTTAAEFISEPLGEPRMTENYDESQYQEQPQEPQSPPHEPQSVDRFDNLFHTSASSELDCQPLPEVGTYNNPATLTFYHQHQPAYVYELEENRTLIGRYVDNSETQPDLDLSEFDSLNIFAHQHCCIYRQNKNYTLYVLTNSGTQLNNQILQLGERKVLHDGDVIVLSGMLAIKFDLAA